MVLCYLFYSLGPTFCLLLQAELKTIFLMGKHILLKREWSNGIIIRTAGGVSGTLETI